MNGQHRYFPHNQREASMETENVEMGTVTTEVSLRLTVVEKEVEAISRRIACIEEKLKAVDPATFQEMEERGGYLSSRLRLLIDKTTVLTEVAFHARHGKGVKFRASLLAAAIWAFDRDDSWWKAAYYDLSVAEWAKRCLDDYRADKLLHFTKDKIDEVTA